jgi:hypothetical protein
MLFYDILYIILSYFNYFNLYPKLLKVIISYYKLLYPKLLFVILQ